MSILKECANNKFWDMIISLNNNNNTVIDDDKPEFQTYTDGDGITHFSDDIIKSYVMGEDGKNHSYDYEKRGYSDIIPENPYDNVAIITYDDIIANYHVSNNNTLDAVFANGSHIAITIVMLKSLNRRGNMVALELLKQYNKPCNFEDLTQKVALEIVEAYNNGDVIIKDGLMDFENMDSEIIRGFYRVISNEMYKQVTRVKNHSSLFINIKGDEVCITDIQGLAAHSDINKLYSLDEFNNIRQYIENHSGKINKLLIHDTIAMLVLGYKPTDIQTALNITRGKYRGVVNKIKEVAKEYYNK